MRYFLHYRIVMLAGLCAVMLLSSSSSGQFSPDQSHRKRLNFNIGWKYYLGQPAGSPETAAFNDASWEDVCTPHTMKLVTKDLDKTTDCYVQQSLLRHVGWYRKHFSMPADCQGRKVFIEFEGVMQVADVWVNGTYIGKHEICGYDGFSFDITKAVTFGGADNVIAVKADNRRNPNTPPDDTLPCNGGWTEGMDYILFGGIYRDVYLHVTDMLHVGFNWDAALAGVFVTTPVISEGSAVVQVRSTVKNEYAVAKKVTFVSTVFDTNNLVVATMTDTASIAAGSAYTFTQRSNPIPNPRLWSPSSPYRYNLYTSVRDGSLPANGVDGLTTKFGMRWYQVNPASGFYLNGKSLKLIGINRHQTWPWVGGAVPNTVHRREASQIKSIGCNWIRLSHYPQDPGFLDAMDSLGLLALEEAATWSHKGNVNWTKNLVLSFRKMIRRDRNHPSVILWNANINHWECLPDLNIAAHQEDSTRKTASPPDAGGAFGCDIPAPMCFNPPGVPGGGSFCVEHTGHLFPTKRTDGEAQLVGHAMQHAYMIDSSYGTPGNSGMAGWCMYDYNTVFVYQYFAPHGLCDLFRIPKYAFYWYRAELTSDPMAFIANYWTANSPKTVTVFSNCDQVELFVNGVSKGLQSPNRIKGTSHLKHPPFVFPNLTFQSGELKAIGRIGGASRATYIIKTPGSATALAIEADPPELIADGADFARIIVSVVDNQGTVVPGAANPITFSISGPGKLLGESPINAEAGKIINLARSTLQTGTITVTASSGSLQGKSIGITVRQRPPDEIPVVPVVVDAGRSLPPSRKLPPALCLVVDGRLTVPALFGNTPRGVCIYDLSGHRILKMKAKGDSPVKVDKSNYRRFGLFIVKPE